MKEEHWALMGLTAGLVLAVLAFSLRDDPKRRFFVWARLAFFRLSLLLFGGMLGGVGLNAVSGGVTLLLGLPGYAALTALSMM